MLTTMVIYTSYPWEATRSFTGKSRLTTAQQIQIKKRERSKKSYNTLKKVLKRETLIKSTEGKEKLI